MHRHPRRLLILRESIMLSNEREINRENLLNEIAAMIPKGFRFATMTCIDVGDSFEILYHFDKDYQLHTLRLKLHKGQKLPSISDIIFAAVIVENEMKDLFGIQIKGLALDYEGKLMLAESAPVAPLRKPEVHKDTN
jgi:NADH:ubiquinone oxidoreductase subunit C